MRPGLGLGDGIGLGMYCKLALLPCPAFPPLLVAAADPAAGVRPSLCTSLPYDMIDRDLPWPFTALLGVLTGMGALCKPPPTLPSDPLTILSDNAGLWPLAWVALDTDIDRTRGVAFP